MSPEKSAAELRSMKEILQWAIKREEASHAFYLQAKELSRTPAEAELFDFLAKQELGHKSALVEQLELIEAQVDIDRALSYDVY
jgi:rubrerythrin